MVGTTGNNVCRRCKKKRAEDEPIETARYRTCKPCREIERKLKRIKKAQLTGQSVDEIHAEIQSKKAQEIEQNVIQMARQLTNALPQSDVQGLADAVNGDLLHHQHHLNDISAAVSAAAAAVNAVNQGPPQIHQYDQSRDNIATQHQPMMPVQSAIDAQKEIPIDESLLKQGTDDDVVNASSLQSTNGARDKASLTKSPILKSEVSPSTAVSTTGEQTDSKPTPQQFNNNNIIDNININNKEGEGEEEEKGEEVAHQAELEASLTKHNKNESNHYCLYCGAERSIDDNGRYNLCGNCVNNPLQKENVYDDFDSYLTRIESGQRENLHNIIFIKKNCSDMSNFIQNSDSNNLEQIVTELNKQYIYRIMEVSGFRFSKSSSNFSAKPFPKSIKLLFKCKQDIKTVQKPPMISPHEQPAATVPGGNNSNVNNRRLKTEDCHSNFYLSYDVIGKSLNIKFNHVAHTPYLSKLYTDGVIDKVRQIATEEDDAKRGFILWREIIEQEQNPQLKNEMSTVKEMVFSKDFGPFFKDFAF